MNLKTIARLAEVSVPTVSKAFAHSQEISDATREKVFKVAKELGCFDKYNKNKFSKKVVAVICPELCSDFYNNYITCINSLLEANNCIMTVGVDEFSSEKRAELFSYYSSYCNVDGIIVIGNCAAILNHDNIPAVCIGQCDSKHNIDSFVHSNDQAFEEAFRYLQKLGHKDIAYAGEKLTYGALEKFVQTTRKLGLRDDLVFVSDNRFESAGHDAYNYFSKLENRPTAVFAAYDNIAIGYIKAAVDSGLSVPEDVSVIGTDDIGVSVHLNKALSTINYNTEKVCRLAVETILEKFKNPYFHRKPYVIKCDFVVRETISRPCK